MKLIKNLPKKSRSISRSDDPSFSSGTTSSSSSHKLNNNDGGISTPTSVLPTDDWYSDIVQAFSVIDNGKIRKEHLEAILSRVGGKSPPTEEELVLLIDELDTNGDGCISLAAFEVPAAEAEAAEMKDAFDFFDEDHDGKITAEELFNVFRMIGDERCTLEECRRMIRSVDKNGDGFVCFEDFCLMMEQQR